MRQNAEALCVDGELVCDPLDNQGDGATCMAALCPTGATQSQGGPEGAPRVYCDCQGLGLACPTSHSTWP